MKKIQLNYFTQEKEYACGPACLRMIFGYYGKKFSEAEMTERCGCTPARGTSHSSLIKTIRGEGLRCSAKTNSSKNDLLACMKRENLIIINYLDLIDNEGHYAVITGYSSEKDAFMLADPFCGNDIFVSWKNLEKRWTNNSRTSNGWFIEISTPRYIYPKRKKIFENQPQKEKRT